jgi:hypothetical protein
MFFFALIMTFWLPLQVNLKGQPITFRHSLWAAQSIMDATKIVGIGNYKYKEPPINTDPELELRNPTKADKPIPKRKKFIQEYVG